MVINVTKDNVTITNKAQVHKGEYNVNTLEFEFSEEYSGISKMAVFSTPIDVYEVPITNNTCIIPHEVLTQRGTLTIGVYGYTVEDEVINKRYSPNPVTIPIDNGSYISGASNAQEQEPTLFEEFVEQIEQDFDNISDDINVLAQSITDLDNAKQDKLTAGTNITIENNVISSTAEVNAIDKIKVNNVEQPIVNKAVNISVPTKTSDISNDSGFITKEVNNLTNYELKTDTGHSIDMTIDTDYVLSVSLKNSAGNVLNSKSVDLPLETMIVNGSYDSATKEVVLILDNGNEIRFSVADLVSGLQTEITNDNKLASDLVDDTNQTNKFVTEAEKSTWNNKSDFSGSYNDLTNKPDLTIYEEKTDAQTKYEQLQAENEALLDQIPTATAEGETIHVEDSSNLPIKDFAMLGNATQVTTTGKNMFNPSLIENNKYQNHSPTNTNIANNSNYWSSGYQVVEANKTYYITTPCAGGICYDINKQSLGIIGGSGSFTTPADTVYIYVSFEKTTKPLNSKIMMNEGSSLLTYEPYTGGTPSPSPDYPQDIHVVTGDNTLKVLGKNLFNPALLTQVEGYNTYNSATGLWTTSSSGSYARSIFYSATGSGSSRDITKLIKLLPATQYTIKFYNFTDYTGDTNFLDYAFFDNTGSKISGFGVSTTTSTFTSPNQECYLDIRRGKNSGYFTFSDIQLEQSSTATTYEPYTEQTQLLSLGSIELAKIGDYTDRIYKDNGKWYVEKNIGKRVLTGQETFGGTSSTSSRVYFTINFASYGIYKYTSSTAIPDIMSTKFSPQMQSGSFYPNHIALVTNDRQMHFIFEPDTTEEQARTILANMPVYFRLNTPTTTEITDTTLIAQLENVLKMHTNKNVTNGWIEPTGTNAQAGMVLVYRQDIGTLITNNTNAILSLGGNV